MTAIDDPFAGLPDVPFAPGPADLLIEEGADVEAITRHPVFGTVLHCRGWLGLRPWLLVKHSRVVAHRGDSFDSPSSGFAGIMKLRRNGTDVQRIAVGMDDPDVCFDLVLDDALPIEVGDTLTFERR
jgi:hypothetical protein